MHIYYFLSYPHLTVLLLEVGNYKCVVEYIACWISLWKTVDVVTDKVHNEYINKLSQIISMSEYRNTNLLLILKCAQVIWDQLKHSLVFRILEKNMLFSFALKYFMLHTVNSSFGSLLAMGAASDCVF